jgi:hypothetical protein
VSFTSELYYVVQLNGAPIDFNPITMTGVADSASTAEYCGASVGVKKTEGTRESAHFLGIAVHVVNSMPMLPRPNKLRKIRKSWAARDTLASVGT